MISPEMCPALGIEDHQEALANGAGRSNFAEGMTVDGNGIGASVKLASFGNTGNMMHSKEYGALCRFSFSEPDQQ
jgi:hypothetical protein